MFKPIADIRFSMWKKDTHGAPIMAIFGPGNASGKNLKGLFWSDPEFTKNIFADLLEKGGEGVGYFRGFDNWGSEVPDSPRFSEAENKYLDAMWLEERAVGKYAKDPLQEYKEDYWIRRIEKHYGIKNGNSLLVAIKASSSIVPRYCCLIDRDYGIPFGIGGILGVVGPFTNSSYADFKGDFRLHGPYAYPFHDWGEKILSIMDYATNRKREGTTPFKIAEELEENSIKSIKYLGEVNGVEKNEPLQTLKDYITLNAYFGRYSSEKIKSGVNLYSIIFSGNENEAVNLLKKGIENLSFSSQWGKRFTKLAKEIPIVKQTYEFFPREIERSIPLVEEEIRKWQELIKKIKDTSIPFEAIRFYWLSLDYYNKIQFYIKNDYHLAEERIDWAKRDLDTGIKEAQNSLKEAKSFPDIEKNIKNWLSFLREERARLGVPEIVCSGKNENWHFLTCNGPLLPPLRFENQMLSFFIPQKIERQKPQEYCETKPIKAHSFRFNIFYDKEYLHLLVKMDGREGSLIIFFDPSYSRKNYYQYEIDLNRGIRRENYVELIHGRGLRYTPDWKSGVKVKNNDESTMHFSFPFNRLGFSPKKGDIWGFNIYYSNKDNSFAFCSMLGSVGAPARFGKIMFKRR
jgi:hypothetical protein